MLEEFMQDRHDFKEFVKNARFAQVREDLLFCQIVEPGVN
jgi:hypothetical protein